MSKKSYTVHELATVAGVSVRTLHYYDEIGLLRAAERSDSGYRLYGEPELLSLQQISLYREMEVPLAEIARILDDPDFDLESSLQQHRRTLETQIGRTHQLIATIDKTLSSLEDPAMPITDKELYAGFAPDQKDRVRKEAAASYGEEQVSASERRARKMSKKAWAALKAESDAVNQALAESMGKDPADSEVQALIARHHATIQPFYHPTADIYRGLGSLYVEHPEFRTYYEKYALCLPEFLQKAMTHYADHVLAPEETS